MKIYTRTGDQGETSLLGRSGVSKAEQRVICVGDCDELSCSLAELHFLLFDTEPALADAVLCVQQALFSLGEELARVNSQPEQWLVSGDWVSYVENWIDALTPSLPPLRQFIVPGGTAAAIRAQLSRAICRRLERNMVHLAGQEVLNPQSLRWVNRLSDWLFICARYINYRAGVPEPLRSEPAWQQVSL